MGVLKSPGGTLGSQMALLPGHYPETARRSANLQCSLVHMQQPQTEPCSQQHQGPTEWWLHVTSLSCAWPGCTGQDPATRCSPASHPPWRQGCPRPPCLKEISKVLQHCHSPTIFFLNKAQIKNLRLKLELQGPAMLQSCVFTVYMTCTVSQGLIIWHTSCCAGGVPSLM